MKKIALIMLALAAFLGSAAFAYAEDGQGSGMPQGGERHGPRPGAWVNVLFHGEASTTSREDENEAGENEHQNPLFHEGGKSGTNPFFEGKDRERSGSSTDDRGHRDDNRGLVMGRGIPGVISALGTTSFSLDTQKGGATTTLTVNVDANTKYKNGTTTAAFSSLTVGARVLVLGKVSTSTNSVLAEMISWNMGQPKKGFFEDVKGFFGKHDGEGDDQGQGNSEHGDEGKGKGPRGMGGFLQSLRSFFIHENNASTTASTTVTADSNQSLAEFFKHLFGN